MQNTAHHAVFRKRDFSHSELKQLNLEFLSVFKAKQNLKCRSSDFRSAISSPVTPVFF